LKKSKVVTVLLMAILVFSLLNIAVPALVQCLGDHGTGKITSHSFLVYGYLIQPSVTVEQVSFEGNWQGTTVKGLFVNNENVEVYGVPTATVRIPNEATQTQSLSTTGLPPEGSVWITITFSDLEYEPDFACSMSFAAQPIQSSTVGGSGTGTQTSSPATGSSGYTPVSAGGGFNFASVAVPVVVAVIVVLCSMAGFVMFRKMRLSEEKVKGFTSFDFQNWVMQRLGGHAGSVLDSRKGIDGFTGDNAPLVIKQTDSVGRFQVDSFMNALTQAKARSGVMVAFGFDSEAHAAVARARMNRIDIKLVTVKELIEHKETGLL
jgi:hypothetical protein